jgi:hypothetical protein
VSAAKPGGGVSQNVIGSGAVHNSICSGTLQEVKSEFIPTIAALSSDPAIAMQADQLVTDVGTSV